MTPLLTIVIYYLVKHPIKKNKGIYSILIFLYYLHLAKHQPHPVSGPLTTRTQVPQPQLKPVYNLLWLSIILCLSHWYLICAYSNVLSGLL